MLRKESFIEKGRQERATRKVSKNGDDMYLKRLSRDDEKYLSRDDEKYLKRLSREGEKYLSRDEEKYLKRLSKDDEKYADLGIRKASEEFGVGVEYLLWKKWTLKSQVNIF